MSDIPKGYKKTEVGVIPEDWEVIHISEIANVIGGGTPNTSNQKFWNGDINWFTPTEIGNKKYVYKSNRRITSEGLKNSSAKLLPRNTVLLTSRAGIGNLAITKEEACTNQGFQSLIPKKSVDSEFLYYLMTTKKAILLERSNGSTFLEISPNNVRNILIQYPTKPERSAIATTLSDIDSLIASLEKLIEKKKLIKQGVMRELLTGKRRLPCFSGEWKKVRLGEITELSVAFSKTQYINQVGKFLIMDMGSVSSEGKIIASKRTDLSKDLLNVGDLVMPKDDIGGGNIIGKVGYVNNADSYVLGDHVYRVVITDKNINSLFLSYLINSHSVNVQLKKKVSGSAQLGLSRSGVEEQIVILPVDIQEQTAIANILSDLDLEIEKLKTKHSKLKAIKAGAMQQLLTGKIRLI